jgi:hypothetical protein
MVRGTAECSHLAICFCDAFILCTQGCSGSKEFDREKRRREDLKDVGESQAGVTQNYLPTSGPLTAKDYKSRLATSEGTQTLYFPQSRLTIRYAFVSQRGYYPDSPDKANQGEGNFGVLQ